jgi:hypothetical protein
MATSLAGKLTVGALAAAVCISVQAASTAPAQASATDMARLSKEGSKAMEDISLARLAIFDGRTADADKRVRHAQQALEIAQKDNTAFTKAASDLKPSPSGPAEPKETIGSAPVAWLPVTADITVSDEFSSPASKRAVASADQRLKKGERAQAAKELKLADVDVAYTMGVAPLDHTVSAVNKAADLMTADRFYEADQVLRSVQQSVRYDRVDLKATPAKDKMASTNNAASAASGK